MTVCDWPLDYTSCPCTTFEDDPTQQALYEGMAVELLWNWTGQRYGLCPVEVRPCRSECLDGMETFWGRGPYPFLSAGGWVPVLVGGQWYNVACGSCGFNTCRCGLDELTSIKLPGPIESVTEVRIGGQVLASTAYRVDNAKWLVRTDGEHWPVCQNLAAPADDPDSWSVDYVRGTPVPSGGQVAAAKLACELAKASCGDASCQLPKRVQSVTRQGVTIALLDTFDDVEKGRTGIWLIDSWVSSVNMPVHSGASVVSVDTIGRRSNRRQTWPIPG